MTNNMLFIKVNLHRHVGDMATAGIRDLEFKHVKDNLK